MNHEELADVVHGDKTDQRAALEHRNRDDQFLAINIASGEGVSVRRMLDTILKVDGWPDADVQFDATKPTTVDARMIDITLARERLGFLPQISLEEGLRRTVAWYRENRARVGRDSGYWAPWAVASGQISQVLSTTASNAASPVRVTPFMYQTLASPVPEWRHRMSG
jgi:hypothetical protein